LLHQPTVFGCINQRVETIIHLFINTQKAVLQIILHWATDLDQGPSLMKNLQPLVESVQNLGLPFIPCRLFKSNKFGGFVAENYQALTMLSPWLFRCLLSKEFTPKVIKLPPLGKPCAKWTVQENSAWLKERGITLPTNMSTMVRRSIVEDHHNNPAGPQPMVQNTVPSAGVRELVVLLFCVFGALFATDLSGSQAGN
jgi:hypothetical protein